MAAFVRCTWLICFTDPKGQHLDIVGHSKEELQATLQTIQRMLTVPLWVSPAAEDPLLLEMLQVVCGGCAFLGGHRSGCMWHAQPLICTGARMSKAGDPSDCAVLNHGFAGPEWRRQQRATLSSLDSVSKFY